MTVHAAGDVLLPFQIGAGAVRGRFVRLGPALDSILTSHDYPPAVEKLLGQILALAAALAAALKYDGVFTLQAQGAGPVSLLMADVTSDGHLRGYARYDAERLAATPEDGAEVPTLLGEGLLAFTVDQGPKTDRYQGIVALAGGTLAECAQAYFKQSEQLDTAVKLAVSLAGGRRAAALMVQRMPAGATGSPILTADESEDNWRRAAILLESATEAEMVDSALEPGRLLWRLYHGDMLHCSDPRPLEARCRCSVQRIASTLRSFPRAEVESLKDADGRVVVTCEFCKTAYPLDQDALDAVYEPPIKRAGV